MANLFPHGDNRRAKTNVKRVFSGVSVTLKHCAGSWSKIYSGT